MNGPFPASAPAGRSILLLAEQLRQEVPGGIGTYLSGLLAGLRSLAREAPAVTLYASRTRPEGAEVPGRRAVDPLSRCGIPLVSSRLASRWLRLAWCSGLTSVPRKGGWSLLHAPSLAFPRRPRSPMTVVVHDLAFLEMPEAFSAHGVRWHRAALHRALSSAEVIMVPSEETAMALKSAASGQRLPRVEVVTWGIDHVPLPDLERADALLEQSGVTGAFVVCVGTLEPRKNLGRVVEAFATAGLGDDWWLVMVGPEGWGTTAAVPASVRADRRVVFTGAVESPVLAGLYARAAMAVYAPLREGWGFPAVEAMAAGTPVVASPVPSTGGAAYEVDPRDVSSIAAGIAAVASDGQLRSRLIAAGGRRVEPMIWRATARRHLEIWESIAP